MALIVTQFHARLLRQVILALCIKGHSMNNTSHIISFLNAQNNRGECLHPNSPDSCGDKHINAHSIQRAGLLKKISKDNHVYRIDSSYGGLIKSNGEINFKLKSINKVSTFKGFCDFHDSSLFEPIDSNKFIETKEQAFLYAYRSICRELFVKKNAVNSAKEFIKLASNKNKSIANSSLIGHTLGYNNLDFHKKILDSCLKENNYENINYTGFVMDSAPNILFSGVVYPDYDFNGVPIQSIIQENSVPSLITFCSVPYENKWVYLFSWHKYSNKEVNKLLGSLANVIKLGGNHNDYLFRLVMFACENSAISPEWWDNLTVEQRRDIGKYINLLVSPMVEIDPNYLKIGLEELSNWTSNSILDNSNA